ncbi:hypothetical protein H6G00_00745 [Leptolyngbya sp. FACHB-541]|uniref:hypothetical protein n=1 Tax=Leptolyngbya sp. FACHB-541 TaxID=2692810 RepID=UPI0016854091|nr:hypothetical protein [Leptolyngbya sp. FACHB-541]MBD1995155.1 hypothetical protein [Leptolyngbya sp. FACHB-541]
MANWNEHVIWTGRRAEVDVRGATPPDPSKFRLLLCNGITVTSETNKAAIASAELLQQNGYSRKSYQPAKGSYDTTQKRYEFPVVRVDYTAAGVSLQWSAAVLWADSTAQSSKLVESINTATDRLTITAHGLLSGNEVAITSTSGLPSGAVANVIYYVKAIDVNTVELYTEPELLNIVNFVNTGSGSIHLRLCGGNPVFFANFQTQLIGQDATYPIEINWAYVSPGNVNGV